MTNIISLRSKVGLTDKKIIKLLEDRFNIVKKIWEIKKNNKQELRDKIHEKILLNKLSKETKLRKEFIEQIYRQILNENEKYFNQQK